MSSVPFRLARPVAGNQGVEVVILPDAVDTQVGAQESLASESGFFKQTHRTLRLHRIEAACIPDNLRSLRLLEKAGFQREGLLRSYLRINGVWQDHYLYALVAGDVRRN